MMENAQIDLTAANVPGGVTVDQYNACVVYYFDTQMNSDIMNLPSEDKGQFFQMFTDHAGILEKIFHSGVPLINYILYGDEFYDAKVNPHDGIDDTPSEMVAQYKAWAKSIGLPAPLKVKVKQDG